MRFFRTALLLVLVLIINCLQAHDPDEEGGDGGDGDGGDSDTPITSDADSLPPTSDADSVGPEEPEEDPNARAPSSGGPSGRERKPVIGVIPDATEAPEEYPEPNYGGPEPIYRPPPPPPEPDPTTEAPIDWGVRPYDPTSYNSANGGPVTSEGALDCDFDVSCCWDNVQPPADQLEWRQAKIGGGPPADVFSEFFSTEKTPDGEFLIVMTSAAEPPDNSAQFVSCSVVCTDEPIKVSVEHWQTGDVELLICQRESFFNNPSEAVPIACVPIPADESPGPTEVELPPGEMIDVVIMARQFDGPAVVVIDNIRVDYKICPDDPVTVKPEPPKPDICPLIECDYEGGDICEWADDSQEGGVYLEGVLRIARRLRTQLKKWLSSFQAGEPFEVKSGRFRNWVTGVVREDQGNYAAAYIFPTKTAVIYTREEFEFPEKLTVFFRYYEAIVDVRTLCDLVSGKNVQMCCDDLSNCPWKGRIKVKKDARNWKTGYATCDAGTKRLIFACFSTGEEAPEGEPKHQGACAIDALELYYPNSPEDKQGKKFCAGKGMSAAAKKTTALLFEKQSNPALIRSEGGGPKTGKGTGKRPRRPKGQKRGKKAKRPGKGKKRQAKRQGKRSPKRRGKGKARKSRLGKGKRSRAPRSRKPAVRT